MSWIRRKWTAADADDWHREDTLAIILSPLAYIFLLLGPALALLLIPAGFILFAAGLAVTGLLVWVINPKLTALSRAFEKRQQGYIEELERRVKWEEE